MTLEELQKQFTAFQAQTESKLELQKKDFELKLDAAKKDAEQYKQIAETNAATAKAFEEKAKAAEAEKAKAFAEAKKAEVKGYFESCVKAGSLTPAMRDIAVNLSESMTSETVVAKFEQKDGSSVSHTQFSLFKLFVSMIGKAKGFSIRETTPAADTKKVLPVNGDEAGHESFTEVIHGGVKKTLPTQDVDLAARAFQYQEDQAKLGSKVSYETALIHVSKEMKAEA